MHVSEMEFEHMHDVIALDHVDAHCPMQHDSALAQYHQFPLILSAQAIRDNPLITAQSRPVAHPEAQYHG